jgi:hypothetical protein
MRLISNFFHPFSNIKLALTKAFQRLPARRKIFLSKDKKDRQEP